MYLKASEAQATNQDGQKRDPSNRKAGDVTFGASGPPHSTEILSKEATETIRVELKKTTP